MPWTRAQFTVEGQSFDEQKGNPVANLQNISPDYFRVMQIPLISGRDFTARDDQTAPPVLIINEALARLYFPGENPIGKHIRPSFSMGEFVMREIVGVVGDIKHGGLQAEAQPEIYFSHPQMPMSSMTVIVRGKIKNNAWVEQQVLFRGKPELYSPANFHYGSRFTFDRQGHRIGYGAGHYDRAVARLREKGRDPVLIGVAFDCQEVGSVPAEPHDVPLHAILTESGLRRVSPPPVTSDGGQTAI